METTRTAFSWNSQVWNGAVMESDNVACTHHVEMHVLCPGNGKKRSSAMLWEVLCSIHSVDLNFFVQNSFKRNVFPVCLETIEYNGETKEPKPKQQAARRQKRNDSSDEAGSLYLRICLFRVRTVGRGAKTDEVVL